MKRRSLLSWTAFFMLLLLSFPALALAADKTEITWYGQAAFKVKTPTGKVLLIDPWINNPANKKGAEELAKMGRVDLILVTHGHGDHIGNAVEIGKKSGAKLVATFSLGKAIVQHLGFPKEQAGYDTMGNFGGELELLGGEVKVAFIPAVHDSDLTAPVAPGLPESQLAAGNPSGFLITIKDGPVIYHTGDTDLFSDMALVKEYRPVDVMLACMGDHFTMGPRRAAQAVRLVEPQLVVPMHFKTLPVLTGTPEQFRKELDKLGLGQKMRTLAIGETMVWEKP